jgi:hypothetical protein
MSWPSHVRLCTCRSARTFAVRTLAPSKPTLPIPAAADQHGRSSTVGRALVHMAASRALPPSPGSPAPQPAVAPQGGPLPNPEPSPQLPLRRGRASGPLPPHEPRTAALHGPMDNTTKLLEDDQTDAWRLAGDAYDRGRLSVASSRVPLYAASARRGGAGARGGDATGLLGNTTALLDTDSRTGLQRGFREEPARAAAAPTTRCVRRGPLARALLPARCRYRPSRSAPDA